MLLRSPARLAVLTGVGPIPSLTCSLSRANGSRWRSQGGWTSSPATWTCRTLSNAASLRRHNHLISELLHVPPAPCSRADQRLLKAKDQRLFQAQDMAQKAQLLHAKTMPLLGQAAAGTKERQPAAGHEKRRHSDKGGRRRT